MAKRLTIDQHHLLAEYAREIGKHLSAMFKLLNDRGLGGLQRRLIASGVRLQAVVLDLEVRLFMDYPESPALNDLVYGPGPSALVVDAGLERKLPAK